MTNSKYSVIGGGDSTALQKFWTYRNSVDYLSTGGGALIAYLSGQEAASALEILV